MYIAIKHTHLLLATISISLFYFRFFMVKVHGKKLPKLLKILPHIIDSLLLISAAALCILLSQYPFVVSWLTLKLLLVIAYILLAIMAMKAESKVNSFSFLAAATTCLLLVLKLAVTKQLL